MARTSAQAFSLYLANLTPSATERQVAALHRQSLERALNQSLEVLEIRETGSFSHGTGLRGRSDVDLVVSLNYARPTDPSAALRKVRGALVDRFPRTMIKTSSPAVVVPFSGGNETFEITPGFLTSFGSPRKYSIPNPNGGWMETAPEAHLRYVTEVNQAPPGGAKALARLLKAWKLENRVPISSFYLEMAAAEHMRDEPAFDALLDLNTVFKTLKTRRLAALEDPTGHTGHINPTSSLNSVVKAVAQIDSGSHLLSLAISARYRGDELAVFGHLGRLFNGAFPQPSDLGAGRL